MVKHRTWPHNRWNRRASELKFAKLDGEKTPCSECVVCLAVMSDVCRLPFLKPKQSKGVASSISGWWFQPVWKILVKWKSSPTRGENKNIWNQHPDLILPKPYAPLRSATMQRVCAFRRDMAWCGCANWHGEESMAEWNQASPIWYRWDVFLMVMPQQLDVMWFDCSRWWSTFVVGIYGSHKSSHLSTC